MVSQPEPSEKPHARVHAIEQARMCQLRGPRKHFRQREGTWRHETYHALPAAHTTGRLFPAGQLQLGCNSRGDFTCVQVRSKSNRFSIRHLLHALTTFERERSSLTEPTRLRQMSSFALSVVALLLW